MWKGGSYGSPPGPIYNHDTRYFWLPESIRDSAQAWEYDTLNGHRSVNPDDDWIGHCNGITCASLLEPDPPSDCGALSQDDLEGLLAEMYYDCYGTRITDSFVKPSDLWLTLREYMGEDVHRSRSLAVDFDTVHVWFFAVYGYRIDGDLIDDTLFRGWMELYYEEHTYDAQHDPGSARYRFECTVTNGSAGLLPTPNKGVWLECHGPHDLSSPPDRVFTADSLIDSVLYRNPYVNDSTMAGYDRLKRVIEHKTIILDDAYIDGACPCIPPGGDWVRRPGYADSCWAYLNPIPAYNHWVYWTPRLCSTGQWSIYAYKTRPAQGEQLDTIAQVFFGGAGNWHYDQSESPYDSWQMIDTRHISADSIGSIAIANQYGEPRPCYTYYDALRLEYVGAGGGEGGASAAAVTLGDGPQRTRVMPNPVRGAACLSYTVSTPGRADVVVYDVMGRAVLRAQQDAERAGPQNATISLDGLPAGAYIARVNAGGEHSTCRFVVCR